MSSTTLATSGVAETASDAMPDLESEGRNIDEAGLPAKISTPENEQLTCPAE